MDSRARSRRQRSVAAACFGLLVAAAAGAAGPAGTTPHPASAVSPFLEYISPLPGSDRNLPETNIIIRPAGDEGTISTAGGSLVVSGSASGTHEGRLRRSDDGRTITLQPDLPFHAGEVVTVRLGSAQPAAQPEASRAIEFRFRIAGPERETLRDFRVPFDEEGSTALPADSLPADFPKVSATILGNPSPGRLFLCNFNQTPPPLPSYLLILENDGTPFFHRRLAARGHDFKLQPDGRLTYFDAAAAAFYAMDSTHAVVDSFRTGNGYTTDLHECLVLPNGHVLLMAYDPQIVDMTPYDPKGRPDATVIGLIVQEIDREKDVVFQWRSWDHFEFTDAIGIPLGLRVVDYVHGNSIEADHDGNIILSSRNLNEITKISRATGEILWRFGGKNNQFRFSGDPIGFSRQHDARRQASGTLTLFDNGNFHTPAFSRAVEYDLDEERFVAKLVWEYRHQPDVHGPATGSVQRLPTGNTLIEWGTTTPTLTEVTPKGDVVHELSFDPGVFSYRAFRFEWPPVKFARVDIYPRSLNIDLTQGWVTATIEPVGFDAASIDVATVRLEGTIPAGADGAAMGDANSNGVRDLVVTFDRAALMPLLTPTTTQLEVSGALRTGERFRGFADVRVDGGDNVPQAAASLQVVSRPGVLPVELAFRDRVDRTRTLAVYDVQGRLVKRWRAPVAGGRRASWDGRRADGRPAASGIYFARVEDPALGAVAKIVIAR